MATIGVFALNLSKLSGGVFSLINELMASSQYSKHNFLFFVQNDLPKSPLPYNVRVVGRHRFVRLATQIQLNLPGMSSLLRNRAWSEALLAGTTGIDSSIFHQVDIWLWPHAFSTFANLGRTVIICHDMIHLHYPDLFSKWSLRKRYLAENNLDLCEKILCPSIATSNDLLQIYPELSEKVVPFTESPSQLIGQEECSIELRQLQQQFGNIFLMLYVAVDWPHKNHKILVDAALELKQRGLGEFRILFVGHRRTGALRQLIARRKANDIVLDMGSVTQSMLAALYFRAQIFLFPSLAEGFGIPLVEAMHAGLPILASNLSCIPEICGDKAILLPPENHIAWADHIQLLMTNKNERGKLAKLSSDRGKAFGWEQTWKQIDKAFNE